MGSVTQTNYSYEHLVQLKQQAEAEGTRRTRAIAEQDASDIEKTMGRPLTTSERATFVESAIKQMNEQVKGLEKSYASVDGRLVSIKGNAANAFSAVDKLSKLSLGGMEISDQSWKSVSATMGVADRLGTSYLNTLTQMGIPIDSTLEQWSQMVKVIQTAEGRVVAVTGAQAAMYAQAQQLGAAQAKLQTDALNQLQKYIALSQQQSDLSLSARDQMEGAKTWSEVQKIQSRTRLQSDKLQENFNQEQWFAGQQRKIGEGAYLDQGSLVGVNPDAYRTAFQAKMGLLFKGQNWSDPASGLAKTAILPAPPAATRASTPSPLGINRSPGSPGTTLVLHRQRDNIDPGNVLVLHRQRDNTPPPTNYGAINITIQGNVYGVNDLQSAINNALDRHDREHK